MDCSLPGSSVPWDSPRKNTVVSCHFLLQGIFPTRELSPGVLRCRQILYRLSYKGMTCRLCHFCWIVLNTIKYAWWLSPRDIRDTASIPGSERSPDWEDPLEEGVAWRIPWTEEPSDSPRHLCSAHILLFKTLFTSSPPGSHHLQPCTYNSLCQDVPLPAHRQCAWNGIAVSPTDSLWDAPCTAGGMVIPTVTQDQNWEVILDFSFFLSLPIQPTIG